MKDLYSDFFAPLSSSPARTRTAGGRRNTPAALARRSSPLVFPYVVPFLSQTLAHPPPVAYPSKFFLASAAAAAPPLSGRYEVVIPYRQEVIFFTDSLAEAARHVAKARWGDADKTAEVLDFLERVERLGFLSPGQHGVRVRQPLDDGGQWTAKVRGAQSRPQPKYTIGNTVEAQEENGSLPPYLKAGRVLRISGVVVVNDNRPGRQYGYLVGGGQGQRVSENCLRPFDAVNGELDFEGESA